MHEDEEIDGEPIGHEGCRVASEGGSDDDEVAPVIDCFGHGVGVLTKTGVVVIAREVRRTVSCPRSRSSRSTRCQYHPTSAAPWIRAKIAIESSPRMTSRVRPARLHCST